MLACKGIFAQPSRILATDACARAQIPIRDLRCKASYKISIPYRN